MYTSVSNTAPDMLLQYDVTCTDSGTTAHFIKTSITTKPIISTQTGKTIPFALTLTAVLLSLALNPIAVIIVPATQRP